MAEHDHTDGDQGPLGLGSRLDSGPSRTLAESAFTWELEAADHLLPGLSYADLAHTVALIDAGAIDVERGRNLVERLLAFHPVPPGIELDPSVGDLYNNRDSHLAAHLGDEAGLIHLGRARREATTIAWQLAVRNGLLDLASALVDLGEALVEVAGRHRTTYMPDFTYLHHAHPTTLAHYLLGFAFPFERDLVRVRSAMAVVNRSPAGSGSVNGSRFDIDRRALAALLGFDGVVEHTRDAMWAPDLATETLAVVVTTMTNVDRLAEELQIWTTEEFGFVELADAHSRTSVVMPQKKNPYALSLLRGEARHSLGTFVGVVATGLTPTGQPDNRVYAYVDVPVALDRTARSVALLADVLTGAVFDVDRMREAAGSGYTYATDYCDHLALETGLDNRSLHRIVGLAVRRCVAEGGRPVEPSDVREAAAELGIDLPDFDDAALVANRDPATMVAVRRGMGNAGAEPVSTMLADLEERSAAHGAWVADHPLRGFPDRFIARIREIVREL
jgi:argininosuccinate lyase